MKNASVFIRRCLLVFLLAAATAPAEELKIVRVYTGWREASAFKHISEYFSGKENTHGETMLRTRPVRRDGYYFLVRTANSGTPQPVKITIMLSMPGEPKPRSHTFAAELPAGPTVLNLGLTGPDWPGAETNPVAWKLDITADDGRILATEKSYLWEKPTES